MFACRFEYLDLTKDADNFTELFEIPVHDDMLVSDVKQVSSTHFLLLPPSHSLHPDDFASAPAEGL